MTEDHFFELPDGKKFHYVRAGSGDLKIILIHGGDRKFQNASHWKEMLDWMASLGEVFAFDLLGHGKSVPGEDYEGEKIPPKEQVEGLRLFAEELKQKYPSAKFLWVGRSYGGYIVLSLLGKSEQLIDAIVFIAPAVYPSQLEKLDEKMKKKPVLLFWAEDDPIIPFYRHKQLLDSFENITFVSAGKVLERDMERWQAHTPELVKKELFKETFVDFVKSIV